MIQKIIANGTDEKNFLKEVEKRNGEKDKKVGEIVEFGGLLGSAPVMPVHPFGSESFIARGGRIPAPMHSLKN